MGRSFFLRILCRQAALCFEVTTYFLYFPLSATCLVFSFLILYNHSPASSLSFYATSYLLAELLLLCLFPASLSVLSLAFPPTWVKVQFLTHKAYFIYLWASCDTSPPLIFEPCHPAATGRSVHQLTLLLQTVTVIGSPREKHRSH